MWKIKNKYQDNPKTKQLHNMWHNMLQRCNNPKNPGYKYWGGRGIKVCKRWHSFEQFLSDEYEPYDAHRQLVGSNRKNLTIDRINNDGNYELGNIRYISMKIQCKNRRPTNDRFITFNGKTMNISQWAKELNIKASTLYQRLNSSKWSIEKTLSTKVNN